MIQHIIEELKELLLGKVVSEDDFPLERVC